jgi:uncharacterized membrane protein YjfL (UPF0719 family)
MAKDSFDRMLGYQARHAGWIIFRSVYWALYLLLLGMLLLFYSIQNISISLQVFFGWAFSILAIMIIIYGAVEVLHHKLMKKYG